MPPEVIEKTSDKDASSAATTHKSESQLAVDAQQEAADKYKSEMEQRKKDAQSGKGGDAVLDSLPLTIEDKNGKSVAQSAWEAMRSGSDGQLQPVVVPDVTTVNADGSQITVSQSGFITRTVDANGKERKFEYAPHGNLEKVTEEDGSTWFTKDGRTWTTTDGRTWTGTIKIDRDGTYRYIDDDNKETIKRPDGRKTVIEANGRITDTLPDGTTAVLQQPVDREEITRLAESLHGEDDDIFGNVFKNEWQTEERRNELARDGKLLERINRLNPAERQALKGIYHEKYGTSLGNDYKFLPDEDKVKLDVLLANGDPLAQKADRLMAAIDKSNEEYSLVSYRTNRKNSNYDIRDSLSSMRSDEIQEVDQYFKRVYGTSLRDAIKQDTPRATRDMCEIYLKGYDKREASDYTRLDELRKKEERKVDGVVDTDLTNEELKDLFSDNFSELDRDKNGHVDKDEIDKAMVDSDFKGKDAQLIAVLKDKREELEDLSDDEWGPENDGVTKADMRKLVKLTDKDEKTKEEEEFVESVENRSYGAGKALERGNRNLWGKATNPIDSIRPEAIDQGRQGDCWFLAALASVSTTPEGKESIKNMIEDNGDGTYTVTFPGDRKHPVTVDEPTQAELAYGASATEDGIWVAVLEKAYGKYYGKHNDNETKVKADAIGDGGSPEEAFKTLTNRNADYVELESVSKDATHRRLTRAMEEGYPVTAGIGEKEKESNKDEVAGLPDDHEYTVMAYNSDTRTIKLRNPHSKGEPENADGEARDGKNDGIFEMSMDEFYATFDDVTYGKI